MALSSRTVIRITFCAVLALFVMAITMLSLMIIIHFTELKVVTGGKNPNCCFICPSCGARTSLITN